MPQIQVVIHAPGNRQRTWRLPADQLIGLLVPKIVERMGLPSKLDWSLVAVEDGRELGDDETLAQERIGPGAALRLQPVRNTVFKQFLEGLYGEAEGYVQDQLWEKALDKMQQIHEYEPRFPDPKGLLQAAQIGATPSVVPVSGLPWAATIGALVLAGTLAVGTAVVGAGVAGYAVWEASHHRTEPQDRHHQAPSQEEPVEPHTGDVQITLEWYDTVDLDLHVQDPNGEQIYFDEPTSTSGGELDVDANYPCSAPLTSSPLENVYWPWGGAPEGEYRVYVVYFSDCTNEGTVDYRVTVRVDGDVLDTYSGQLSPGDEAFVTSFQY